MTANAEAIHQITTRREIFPKWVENYGILRQFGENVITCEGAVWRMHRKATSASFNERNTALVFREAIYQAQGMVKSWVGPEGQKSGTLDMLYKDIMRMALHIIGYVGFGLRLLWPGQSLPPGTDPRLAKYASLDAAPGHSLSFVDTIEKLLENLITLLVTPAWLLRESRTSSLWSTHNMS